MLRRDNEFYDSFVFPLARFLQIVEIFEKAKSHRVTINSLLIQDKI